MVDAASRVQLAAAQVQDRRLRRRRGSRRDRLPRHRLAHRARAGGRGTASVCWSAAAWAARPMSARRSGRSCEKEHLLSYIESILRVYNLHGRRDNINKARIKILVNQLGIDKFREEVEADWAGDAEGRRRSAGIGICPHRLLFRPARPRALARSRTRASSSAASPIRPSPIGSSTMSGRIACLAM